MNELDKLAEVLTERHHALKNYPSDGGNPTIALSGALTAIKEIVESIHAVRTANVSIPSAHPITDAWAYSCGGDHTRGTSYQIPSPIGGAVPTDIARHFERAAREALEALETIRTERLACAGMPEYATAISTARVALDRVLCVELAKILH